MIFCTLLERFPRAELTTLSISLTYLALLTCWTLFIEGLRSWATSTWYEVGFGGSL
jgi:hypothetical protein